MKARLHSSAGSKVRSLLAMICLCFSVCSLAHAQDTGSVADKGPPTRHSSKSGVEERVRTLTHALNLDEAQQSELQRILESQREQVAKIWADSSVAPGYRIIATQAISDKTADRIRGLLNDEQRKRFNPPKPPHDAASGAARPNVEDWINPPKAQQK